MKFIVISNVFRFCNAEYRNDEGMPFVFMLLYSNSYISPLCLSYIYLTTLLPIPGKKSTGSYLKG